MGQQTVSRSSNHHRMTAVSVGWLALAFAVTLGLSGCGGPAPTEAERLIERYFEAVGAQRYDDVLPLYSDLFFEKTPREDWKQALANVRNSLGELQTHKVQRPLKEREEGPEGSYRLTLIYIVQYSRFKAEETITVFQEPSGGPLNILEHNIRYLEES